MINKYRIHNFLAESSVDARAYMFLNPLIKDFPYLPYTGSALRPAILATVINDIVINGRRNIIEFGSGVSTLVIAKYISTQKESFQFYSIEESQEWSDIIARMLREHGLDQYVTQLVMPISTNANGVQWYDDSFLNKVEKVDCMIIDGPNATKDKSIRKHALPMLQNKLGKKFSVFLDDCNRPGEFGALQDWSKSLNTKYLLLYQSLGLIFKGSYFNVSI